MEPAKDPLGHLAHAASALEGDMLKLQSLLHATVAPHLRVGRTEDVRILNLACGQCDEAGTLVNFGKTQTEGAVSLIGADIRIREVLQARENHSR
ncbi:MAG: hypothetical protein ACOYMN_07695, partial [Roseimicrobium sp.]